MGGVEAAVNVKPLHTGEDRSAAVAEVSAEGDVSGYRFHSMLDVRCWTFDVQSFKQRNIEHPTSNIE